VTAGWFWRDKAPYLAGLGFSVLLSAVLLWVLSVHPGAIALLCLVFLLGGLLPLTAEYIRKKTFYDEAMGMLDALERKYLFSELLEQPSFPEGVLFCRAMEETNKAMNDALAAARRDMADYREYIETWVHEVKTPIASARLTLENLPGPPLQGLEEALFQIEGYVEQALFYARSGAVERDYVVRPMALRQAASDAVKKYARPLIAAGFSVELEGLDAVAYADGKWVEFILGQLISNAIKYRGEHPRLVFTQSRAEQSVALNVADNGVGIPQADLPRVCEKGFTGENGRKLSKRSTGLGLYLCRTLCGRLGLGFSIASQAGEGTRVSIIFPKGRFYLLGEREELKQ